MVVYSGCVIGDLMEDDFYNLFCVDGIDLFSLLFIVGEFFCIYRSCSC